MMEKKERLTKYYYHKEKQMWCRRTKATEARGAYVEGFPWVQEEEVLPRHMLKLSVMMLADFQGVSRVRIHEFGMIRNSRIHNGLVAITLYNESWRKKDEEE
jgi:hypothetical protein